MEGVITLALVVMMLLLLLLVVVVVVVVVKAVADLPPANHINHVSPTFRDRGGRALQQDD